MRSRRSSRLALGALAATGASTLILAGAAAAHAAPSGSESAPSSQGDDVDTSGGSMVLALWQSTGAPGELWPQTLVASIPTNSSDISLLDAQAVGCGTFQVDRYRNDAITAALLAAGAMSGPGALPESFAVEAGFPIAKVFTNTVCAPPPAPEAVDACGIEADTITIPEALHVEFTTEDLRVDGVGEVRIRAQALGGFTFPAEAATSWSFDFADAPCAPESSEPEPSQPEPSQPEPEPSEPEPSQPQPSQPQPSQPEPSEPVPSEPEPVQPEPSRASAEAPSLPSTGVGDASGMAGAAALLALIGGLLSRRARTRR